MEDPGSSMPGPRVNFGFAFNDTDFSDRVLHMEIMADYTDSNKKRKREKLDKENDSESTTIVKVKTYHISSLILAGNSPFFHKLFKNGMRESQQRDTTLQVNESEEAAVMELLNFMYTNTLKASTTPDLLSVLVAADKFEVSDCMRYCSQLLQKMPMSLEYALLYLKLPSSVLVSEVVQPLIDAAKEFLVTRYKDINKSQEEAMTLPLSAVEVVLGSHSLQVDSPGDDVFEFILKWAHAHYPEHNKRRDVLTKRLVKFIRFQYMSRSKLKEVLACPDFDHEKVSKLILETLIFMLEVPYGQRLYDPNKCQVIKVEQDEPPQPRCIVYFDLKKEDCEKLFPSSKLPSQSFRLGGRLFYLQAACWTEEQRSTFSLCLSMEKGSNSCTLDYEFAVIRKSSMDFQQLVKDKDNFLDTSLSWVFTDLFEMSWTDFLSKDSEYFIDGILHLRADITIIDGKD